MIFSIKITNVEQATGFCKLCEKQDFNIDMKVGRYMVDGKSLLGVLSLDLGARAAVILSGGNETVYDEFYEKVDKLGYDPEKPAKLTDISD